MGLFFGPAGLSKGGGLLFFSFPSAYSINGHVCLDRRTTNLRHVCAVVFIFPFLARKENVGTQDRNCRCCSRYLIHPSQVNLKVEWWGQALSSDPLEGISHSCTVFVLIKFAAFPESWAPDVAHCREEKERERRYRSENLISSYFDFLPASPFPRLGDSRCAVPARTSELRRRCGRGWRVT